MLPSSELFSIIAPALIVGLMVALTHAPLGIEVLRRGIIFIDLAVAQIAGLGLLAADMLLHHPPGWVVQLIALGCALLAGLGFLKAERTMPEQLEAIIGSSFVLAASLAILLLIDHPHGGQEMQHLLSGEMLFVNWSDIALHAPIYIAILLLWFLYPAVRRGLGFYLLFALAITSSVQLAGVYVVFASLILPALAAVGSEHPLRTAWLCGLFSLLLGLSVSLLSDLPAGPIIVVSYTSITCIVHLLRFAKTRFAHLDWLC